MPPTDTITQDNPAPHTPPTANGPHSPKSSSGSSFSKLSFPGKFSRQQLLIFAAAFALIGAFFIFRSFAAVSTIATIQAEQMTLPSGASIISDSNASGGQAVKFTQKVSATGSVDLSSTVTSLTVRAKETACRGDASFTLTIDNTPVITKTVTSSSWADYSVTGLNLTTGSHALSLTYNNPYSWKKCSRALFVDKIDFFGEETTTTPIPTVSLSANPATVTSGSTSNLTWSSTNATSCTASGAWTGTKPTSGTETTAPITASATYTLSCTGTGGTGSGSVGVTVSTTTTSPGIWQPALNTPFMWLLEHPLNTASAIDMGTGVTDYLGNPAPDPVAYDIDGFDNPASTVTTLHGMGKKAVCYISAGTWENWRPDAGSFPDSVKGSNVSGWAGERWLDVRQISILGPIMQSRLDMCKNKGFDAAEFDNVDGYTNNSGFALTGADQIAYNKYLADEAHKRGLSAALKNDVDQIPSLWQNFDFAINEQCNQYSECGNYSAYFIKNNKAVFEIEYKMAQSNFCPTMNTQNINSLLMPLDLNGGRKPCR